VNELLLQLERELVAAGRRRKAARRARRRLVTLLALLGALLLAAVSVASAVSGQGPLAGLLGVRDDPTLRSVNEVRDGQRVVLRARSASGQGFTLALFEARGGPWEGGGYCVANVTDGSGHLYNGLGCGSPDAFAREVRRRGLYVTSGGSDTFAGAFVTYPVHGFAPASARSVTVRERGGEARRAALSPPFRLGAADDAPRVRAFLAVVDSRGDPGLTGFASYSATARLADGSTRRASGEQAIGFPLAERSEPGPGAERIKIALAAPEGSWAMVAYEGQNGALCSSAAPKGERVITPGQLQCSPPLAILDAFQRTGVAPFASGQPNPGSYSVRGFVRADARVVTVIDQRGRARPARLSRPWTTIHRTFSEREITNGRQRALLERLPESATVRSFLAVMPAPPTPDKGQGLRIQVALADGRTLAQP
jgi:hypothetical protein